MSYRSTKTPLRIRLFIAGLWLSATLAPAFAQQFNNIPAQSVLGRLGIPGDTGPSQAIPFATLKQQLGSGGTIIPQARITLASGVPVMGASVAAATTVYVTPVGGNLIPIYDGSNFNAIPFPEVSQATTDTTMAPGAVAPNSNYDIFCYTVPAKRCTRGQAWTGDTTRGAGATDCTAAGTVLVLVNGICLNAVAITNGPPALRGTYMGTIRSNSSSTIDYILGGFASTPIEVKLGVWNLYNRVPVNVFTGIADNGGACSYSVATTWRQRCGKATFKIDAVRGLDIDSVDASDIIALLGTSATLAVASIGLDSVTSPHANSIGIGAGNNAAAASKTNGISSWTGLMGLGWHYLAPLDWNSTTTSVFFYTNDSANGVQYGMKARLWQ